MKKTITTILASAFMAGMAISPIHANATNDQTSAKAGKQGKHIIKYNGKYTVKLGNCRACGEAPAPQKNGKFHKNDAIK